MKRKPNSIRLLEVMSQRPSTRMELQRGSGLELDQVKDALWNLRMRGMAVTKKVLGELAVYEITQKGLYHLHPETDPARRASAERAYRNKLIRNAKYRKAKQVARQPKATPIAKPVVDDFPIERRVVPAHCVADSIVSTALQRRPAFQAAWH